MEFTRTQRIVIGAGIGVVLIAGAAILALRGCGGGEVAVVNAAEQQIEVVAHQATGYVAVHVIGAVHRPGLYYLHPRARVYDAVSAAGGFMTGADDQAINLAAFVQDGEQVRVPARRQAAAAGWSGPPPAAPSVPAAAPSPSRAASPAPAQSAAPPAPTSFRGSSGAAAHGYPVAGAPTAPAAAPGGEASQPAGQADRTSPGAGLPVNINYATEQQLEALPGVGPVLAGRIVSHRMEHGPFERPEDLLRVRGIGQQTLARMAPYISVP